MNPRDRRALVLGGGGLGLIALIWVIILPWAAHWSAARDRIDQSRGHLQELREQTERLSAMDRQLEPVIGAGVKKPLANLEATRTQFIKDLMDLHMKAGAPIRSLTPESVHP